MPTVSGRERGSGRESIDRFSRLRTPLGLVMRWLSADRDRETGCIPNATLYSAATSDQTGMCLPLSTMRPSPPPPARPHLRCPNVLPVSSPRGLGAALASPAFLSSASRGTRLFRATWVAVWARDYTLSAHIVGKWDSVPLSRSANRSRGCAHGVR